MAHAKLQLLALTALAILSGEAAVVNVFAKTGSDTIQSVSINLNPPSELNFRLKRDILEDRQKIVQQNGFLLQNNYVPNITVFGGMEDFKPWWGMHGAFIWGQGLRSIEGPAEESRFILNPFLLVGVNPATAGIWNPDKITASDLQDPNFPFCWLPKSLIFFPKLSIAQAFYSISDYNRQIYKRINQLRFNPRAVKLNQFGLVAYNARDLGYQYLFVDIAKSLNIVNVNGYFQPVFIKQFIHCGPSSKFPGGCNNMSPDMPAIDRLALSALPARLCILLWKEKPAEISSKPDFTYYIDFR